MSFRVPVLLFGLTSLTSCGGHAFDDPGFVGHPPSVPGGGRVPPESTSPSTTPRANPSRVCGASDVPGEIIQACKFPSDVGVAAVTPDYVAIATRTSHLSTGIFSNIVTSPSAVYWDGWNGKVSGIFTAPIDAASPKYARPFVLDEQGTLTFATAGYVYYFASRLGKSTLYRVSHAGSEPEVLATDLPNPSELGYHAWIAAVDSDKSVYFALVIRESTRRTASKSFA